MADILKSLVLSLQEFFVLTGKALANLFRRPRYWADVITQMDRIGVGSLPIVVLAGAFIGAVMAIQMSKTLEQYGQTERVGQIVSFTIVTQLGPMMTSLLVAGRNASGIASELGSMKVTEQIDAMRALGTDPIQKLVTPRMTAMAVMLPVLTVIFDYVAMLGGWLVALFVLQGVTTPVFWTGVYTILEWSNVAQGLITPFINAFIISLVGCYCGMRTSGGTQGVGKSTTEAVVMSSVWVFVLNLFLTQIFVSL